MCQDPEISFVLIMLPFKRKQFAYYLRSERLFTVCVCVCLVLSKSLYFLVTHSVVTALFFLFFFFFNALAYLLILKRYYDSERACQKQSQAIVMGVYNEYRHLW